jgi:hypothetical protein
MGGFLSLSKWVWCECSITPVFVPTRSRKPLTEIYEFKFNVDTRAIERAMFDQKVWFNSHCLWISCFWKMVTAVTWWSELLTRWSEVVNINCYRSQRNTISTNSIVKNMKLQERYGSQFLLKHLRKNNSYWQAPLILFSLLSIPLVILCRQKKRNSSRQCGGSWSQLHDLCLNFHPPLFPKGTGPITLEVLNPKS